MKQSVNLMAVNTRLEKCLLARHSGVDGVRTFATDLNVRFIYVFIYGFTYLTQQDTEERTRGKNPLEHEAGKDQRDDFISLQRPKHNENTDRAVSHQAGHLLVHC